MRDKPMMSAVLLFEWSGSTSSGRVDPWRLVHAHEAGEDDADDDAGPAGEPAIDAWLYTLDKDGYTTGDVRPGRMVLLWTLRRGFRVYRATLPKKYWPAVALLQVGFGDPGIDYTADGTRIDPPGLFTAVTAGLAWVEAELFGTKVRA